MDRETSPEHLEVLVIVVLNPSATFTLTLSDTRDGNFPLKFFEKLEQAIGG